MRADGMLRVNDDGSIPSDVISRLCRATMLATVPCVSGRGVFYGPPMRGPERVAFRALPWRGYR